MEILRRACIWKHHGPTKGDIGAKWWQYVLYFGEKCGDTFTNENCMHEALKHAEIPKLLGDAIRENKLKLFCNHVIVHLNLLENIIF